MYLGSMLLCTSNDDQLFYFSSYVPIWFPIVHYLCEIPFELIYNYHGHKKAHSFHIHVEGVRWLQGWKWLLGKSIRKKV
jgi:hypothetical protein